MEIISTYVMILKIRIVIFIIFVIVIIIIIVVVIRNQIKKAVEIIITMIKLIKPMEIIMKLLTACKPVIIVTRSNCCLIRLRKFVNSMVTFLLHFSSFSARFSTRS